MTKFRKIIFICALILTIAIPYMYYNIPILIRYVTREEIPERLIPLDIIFYARALQFEFRMIFEGEELNSSRAVQTFTNPHDREFEPIHTDLILVHNREQALEFPDNVITAWPIHPEGLVNGINWLIGNGHPVNHSFEPNRYVTFERFDLTYPLTVDDLIYNWENVDRLFRQFDNATRDAIRSHAPYGGLNEVWWD